MHKEKYDIDPVGTEAEAGAEDSAPKPEFSLSGREVADWASSLGLEGASPDDGLLRLRNNFRRLREGVERWALAKLNTVKRKEVELERLRKELESRKEEAVAGREELSLVEEKLTEARIRREQVVAEVKKERFAASRDLLREEERELREQIQKMRLESVAARFHVEKEIHQYRIVAFRESEEANRVEAESLKGEIKLIERELEELERNQLASLRRRGITLTTAGFLSWSGYSALPAMGLVMSYLLLQNEENFSAGPFSLLWSELVSSASGQIDFAPYAFLAISLVVFVPLAILATDRLLGKISKGSWSRSKRHRGIAADLPSLALPSLQRKHLISFLSWLPFLLLALVVVMFFQWAQTSSGGGDVGSRIASSLSALYIGVGWVLLASSLSVLYSAFVILPRILSVPSAEGDSSSAESGSGGDFKASQEEAKSGENQEASTGNGGEDLQSESLLGKAGGWSRPRAFESLWEIWLAFLLGLVAILVSASPLGENSVLLTWAALSSFVFSATVSFGCGINLKGLFKDKENLEKQRIVSASRVAELLAPPAFEFDVSTRLDGKAAASKKDREPLQRFLADVQMLKSTHALSGAFEPEGDSDTLYFRYWRALKNRSSDTVADPPSEVHASGADRLSLHAIDYVAAVEPVKEAQGHDKEVTLQRSKARRLEQNLQILSGRVVDLESKILAVEGEGLEEQTDLIVLKKEARISEIEQQELRFEEIFLRGFRAGSQARSLLERESGQGSLDDRPETRVGSL